jgi:hypothetical protein
MEEEKRDRNVPPPYFKAKPVSAYLSGSMRLTMPDGIHFLAKG